MKPADFPLGSHHSRAAARSLVRERQSVHEHREVIISAAPSEPPSATDWHFDQNDRTGGRIVSIPEGMILEQGLRRCALNDAQMIFAYACV